MIRTESSLKILTLIFTVVSLSVSGQNGLYFTGGVNMESGGLYSFDQHENILRKGYLNTSGFHRTLPNMGINGSVQYRFFKHFAITTGASMTSAAFQVYDGAFQSRNTILTGSSAANDLGNFQINSGKFTPWASARAFIPIADGTDLYLTGGLAINYLTDNNQTNTTRYLFAPSNEILELQTTFRSFYKSPFVGVGIFGGDPAHTKDTRAFF